jgi:hypothetical protein
MGLPLRLLHYKTGKTNLVILGSDFLCENILLVCDFFVRTWKTCLIIVKYFFSEKKLSLLKKKKEKKKKNFEKVIKAGDNMDLVLNPRMKGSVHMLS